MYNPITTVVMSLLCFGMAAQQVSQQDAPQKTTYLLPEGKVVELGKLDSLENAWGKGRVLFAHNEEDDSKGVVRLVRKTEEMDKKYNELEARRQAAFADMLNKEAAEFELKDLQGKTWSLKKLRGKVVVLNFWFTSCAPCIQEIPELNALVEDYKKQEVVFLGLTYNTPTQVNAFLKKRPFGYTLLPDSGNVDKKYHVSSWPTSMIIDKTGMLRYITNYNPKIREDLKKAISALQ